MEKDLKVIQFLVQDLNENLDYLLEEIDSCLNFDDNSYYYLNLVKESRSKLNKKLKIEC